MALGHYQQTSLTNAGTLLEGGFRMGIATAAVMFAGGSVQTVLGIGNLTSIQENIELSTTQAGNSNMPVERVASQTLTVNFELLEFWAPTFDLIRGSGLDTTGYTASTYITGTPTARSISTGGLDTLGTMSYVFENVTMVSGATAKTVLIVYKARIAQGLAFTSKTDHDTDPVMVYPFVLTAELDTSRTKGDQLFIIESELGV